MYFLPPVYEVCPNHDVVVFLPWTGTAPDLGSVTNYTLNILFYPSCPTCLNRFSGYFHLPPISYQRPISGVRCCSPSLLHPLPTSSTSTKRCPSVIFPHLTPATRQNLPLDSAPRSVCLRLMPFTVSVLPPFSALGLQQGPYQPLRISPLRIHPYSLCLRLSSLCSHPTPDIFWFLVYFRVTIFARGQEARAPPLPGN